jgi:hypothetical protein
MTAAETAFRAEVDEYCAVRPERLTVRPAGDGRYEIHVHWSGQESVLRTVFVRRPGGRSHSVLRVVKRG